MEPAERDECGLSDEASAALASGIGRSSLLAAAVLVEDGVDPDEAWDLISARGYAVPDTEEQRIWLTG
jgi:hypothetical protein